MIRVYKYGLLPPTTNAPLVREQLRAGHVYRNQLVEIERARRAAVREVMTTVTDVAEAEAAVRVARDVLGAARGAIKRARAETRTRSETESMRDAAFAAKSAHKVEKDRLFAARKAARAVLEPRLAEIEDRAGELRRGARALTEAYGLTYEMREEADEASRKMPLYDGDEPNDPRFVRWTGDAMIGVRLHGGILLTELGANRHVQIHSRDERRERKWLRLRVGSEGRDPIWAEWPMILHRLLPSDARIKRVAVQVRRIGPRERWTCTFTIEIPDVPQRSMLGPHVAIDLGWRLIPETREIRVGAWHASDGQHGELRLSAHDVGGHDRVESLRGTRDANFLVARDALVRARFDVEPAWFAETRRTLALWRSPARLAALCRRWKTNRFEGDVEAYVTLESWRYHDHHLWSWESSQRERTLQGRRERYRTFAADLASRFSAIVLEDDGKKGREKLLDLRPFVVTPDVESKEKVNETARRNRQRVAPSELRMALKHAFESRGALMIAVPSEQSTNACRTCGVVDPRPGIQDRIITCPDCGTSRDRDHAAAQTLCERYGVLPDPGGAREGEGREIVETRWQRAKRMHAEKVLAKQTSSA